MYAMELAWWIGWVNMLCWTKITSLEEKYAPLCSSCTWNTELNGKTDITEISNF